MMNGPTVALVVCLLIYAGWTVACIAKVYFDAKKERFAHQTEMKTAYEKGRQDMFDLLNDDFLKPIGIKLVRTDKGVVEPKPESKGGE